MFYIQGTKDASGVWRYDDNTEIIYTRWAVDEPDNGPSDIHLDLWTNANSRIHDVTGQKEYGYICEVNLK